MRTPMAPRGAQEAGRRLWRAVLAEFDLAEHELVLLRQAVHVADVCASLQTVVAAEGSMLDGKAHPALVELRNQRILLARLVVALRVPLADDGDVEAGAGRTQRRGVRGFYSVAGGAG